jgi:hypothetical protein
VSTDLKDQKQDKMSSCSGQQAVSSGIPLSIARIVNSIPLPGIWIICHALYTGFSWVYDYVFFGAVIYLLGPIKGGILLCATTAVLDYYTLKFYRKTQQDLLGIEYLRNLRHYIGSNPLKLILKYVLNYAPTWLQIIVLTPKSNAFLTTALLREGDISFTQMTKRDWFIFWSSFICSQVYWIGMVYLGVEGLEGLYQLIFKGHP